MKPIDLAILAAAAGVAFWLLRGKPQAAPASRGIAGSGSPETIYGPTWDYRGTTLPNSLRGGQ